MMDSKERILRKLINPCTKYLSVETYKNDIETLFKLLLNERGLGEIEVNFEYAYETGMGDDNDNAFEYDSYRGENTFYVNLEILSHKYIGIHENSTNKEIENAYQFNALVLLKEILSSVNKVYVERMNLLTYPDQTLASIKHRQEDYLTGKNASAIAEELRKTTNKAKKFLIPEVSEDLDENYHQIRIVPATYPVNRYINVKAYFDAVNMYRQLITNEEVFTQFFIVNKDELLDGYFIKNRNLTYPLEQFFKYYDNIEGNNFLSYFDWYDKKNNEYMNTLSNVSMKYQFIDRLIYGMPIDNPCEYQRLLRNKLR